MVSRTVSKSLLRKVMVSLPPGPRSTFPKAAQFSFALAIGLDAEERSIARSPFRQKGRCGLCLPLQQYARMRDGLRERIRFGRRAWAENAQEAGDTQSQPERPRRQRVSICEHGNKGESYHGLSRSPVSRNWDAASTCLNVKRTFSGLLRL